MIVHQTLCMCFLFRKMPIEIGSILGKTRYHIVREVYA
jgi:hypothetical protein